MASPIGAWFQRGLALALVLVASICLSPEPHSSLGATAAEPPEPLEVIEPEPEADELGRPYQPRFMACKTSDTEVIDLAGEFEDIWAKVETPWTGKRTSQRPSVSVSFSGPVEPEMLNASFFPRHVSQCGRRIQAGTTTPTEGRKPNFARFSPVRDLRPDCEYTFELVANQALSPNGNCLNKWLVVRFFTRPEGAGVMHELTKLRRTEDAPGLTAFSPREGVSMDSEVALVRYKEIMGVPAGDTLKLDGTRRNHPIIPDAEIVRARQYHKGIFVRSPGYFIERYTDGQLIWARGRAVVIPDGPTTPTVSRATARARAAPYAIRAGGHGAIIGPEDSFTLRYVNGKGTRSSEDYELAWHAPVEVKGRDVGEVDVSAFSGAVLRHSVYAIAN